VNRMDSERGTMFGRSSERGEGSVEAEVVSNLGTAKRSATVVEESTNVG
jgi:hypothetical protein